MLITPLFVRSSLLLKVIVLSTNDDYPIVCPFVLFTEGYCVVHQCWLPHCLSVRAFLRKAIVLSTNAYYHIVVRLSFLLKVIVLFTNVDYAIVVRSSFLLKVIVLSTFADYPIVCPFVFFT